MAKNNVMIIFTFLMALILTILPMPEWSSWMRPAWVLLILIFWTLELPYHINMGVAWIMGIFLDVLNGNLLGEHALALTVVIYLVSRLQTRLKMFPVIQQALIVFLLVLFYQAIIYCIQGFTGQLPRTWMYWTSSVTSMLLWPWIVTLLRGNRKSFKSMA